MHNVIEKINVLIVDDNQHMRFILMTLLRAIGIKNLIEAVDGADGLGQLRVRPIDLILCDINMQPIDGIEFVQMLRRSSDSITPLVPVIMVTGHTQRAKVEAARDAGVNEFVAKPVTAQALLSRIKIIIEKPRPFVRTATYFGPDRRRRNDPRFRGPWRRREDPPAGANANLDVKTFADEEILLEDSPDKPMER